MNVLVGALAFLLVTAAAADAPTAAANQPLLMVVALASNPANRMKFEDTLAAKLSAQGIHAIASHPLIPTLTNDARETVARTAREQHVTAVVGVMPVSVGPDGITSGAPVQMELSEQIDEFLQSALARPDVVKGRIALVTNVYQVSTARLVWGGVSWSFELADVDKLIDETSSMIADNIVTAQRQLERLRARGIDPLAPPPSP